jgi:hypothetical protein
LSWCCCWCCCSLIILPLPQLAVSLEHFREYVALLRRALHCDLSW